MASGAGQAASGIMVARLLATLKRSTGTDHCRNSDSTMKWLWPLGRLAGLLPVALHPCRCEELEHPEDGTASGSAESSPPPATWASARTTAEAAERPPARHCLGPRASRSGAWLAYSLVLTTILVPLSMVGVFMDYASVRSGCWTLRMASETDVLITFCDIMSVSGCCGLHMLLAAAKQDAFFKLVQQNAQVDRLLSRRPPPVPLRLWILLAMTMGLLLFDFGVWSELSKGFYYYFPFYFAYVISFMLEILFINDAYAVYARFKGLNGQLVPRAAKGGAGLTQLTEAHLLLCSAVESVSERYGLSLLCDMMTLLMHLVITAYFFLVHLLRFQGEESQAPGPYQTLQGMWLFGHLLRMLMLVHPCSKAQQEARRTGTLVVCLLNAVPKGSSSHRQLETMSLQLLHHRVTFSACGFFELNLPLVASILGAVTTYLVVLLQLKVNNGDTATNSTTLLVEQDNKTLLP